MAYECKHINPKTGVNLLSLISWYMELEEMERLVRKSSHHATETRSELDVSHETEMPFGF